MTRMAASHGPIGRRGCSRSRRDLVDVRARPTSTPRDRREHAGCGRGRPTSEPARPRRPRGRSPRPRTCRLPSLAILPIGGPPAPPDVRGTRAAPRHLAQGTTWPRRMSTTLSRVNPTPTLLVRHDSRVAHYKFTSDFGEDQDPVNIEVDTEISTCFGSSPRSPTGGWLRPAPGRESRTDSLEVPGRDFGRPSSLRPRPRGAVCRGSSRASP